MVQPASYPHVRSVLYFFLICLLISWFLMVLQTFRSRVRKFSVTLCWMLCLATHFTNTFTPVTPHTGSYCCYCETYANEQHCRIEKFAYCYNSQTSKFVSLSLSLFITYSVLTVKSLVFMVKDYSSYLILPKMCPQFALPPGTSECTKCWWVHQSTAFYACTGVWQFTCLYYVWMVTTTRQVHRIV